MTATQLIERALRDIGGLRAGQHTSPDILADGLAQLNDMLDQWQLDRLMIYAILANQYPLVAGVQTITIGPVGAAITAPRPNQIENANIILNTVNPVVRVPVDIINSDQWADIRVQSLPFAIPQKLYYDKGFNQPNGFGTLNLWPGPGASYLLELFTWQQLQQFADLTTNYTFPPGYSNCIRKNLAVAVAPMMKLNSKDANPLLQIVVAQAAESKAVLMSYNAPMPVLAVDPAFCGGGARSAFNYATGESGRGR
jgi:hypothetical protein